MYNRRSDSLLVKIVLINHGTARMGWGDSVQVKTAKRLRQRGHGVDINGDMPNLKGEMFYF